MVNTEPEWVEPLPEDFKSSYSTLVIAQLTKLPKSNRVPFAELKGQKDIHLGYEGKTYIYLVPDWNSSATECDGQKDLEKICEVNWHRIKDKKR